MHVLRTMCRAIRDVHDLRAYRVKLAEPYSAGMYGGPAWLPPSPEAIEVAIKGVVARGCRPTSVEVALPWTDHEAVSHRRV